MNEIILRKYARLLLEVGVSIEKDQKLIVSAEPCHWDFIIILTEEAYKMGASYVLAESYDGRMNQARVENSSEESLSDIPNWTDTKNQKMIDEGWARIGFFGPENPELAGSLDGRKLGIIQRSQQIAGKPISEACGAGIMPWCVAALPTAKWAAKVFNEKTSPENPQELIDRLWGEMVKILSLDSDNPSEVWRKKSQTLQDRCQKLMALDLKSVRFTGPGTDLTVGCFEQAQWIGGGIKKTNGADFIPNLPTEECFTTPDMHSTQGRVQVVRPVSVLGKMVSGAWFEFQQGKVTDYGAEQNKDALDRFFEMCPQSTFLGELALVDGSSPVYQSGHVYECILYDENASCHIALGNGYPMAVPGGLDMNKEQKLAKGVNVSLLHTDFMIGGPEIDVTGINSQGIEIPLIRKGEFVLD